MIDLAEFRRMLSHYPTGVCVITATTPAGKRVGMSVGSFTSVSLDPLLIGFLPARSSSSWPGIEEARQFCVNVLAAEQQALGIAFARRGDRFAGIATDMGANGAPRLPGSILAIECDLHAVADAGDHLFVTGLVTAIDELGGNPLLFHRGALRALV